MNKTLAVIFTIIAIMGGTGLGIALYVVLFLVNGPARGVEFSYVTSYPLLEVTSTPAPVAASPSRDHILAQIRQLAAAYDQAVQAEKQNGQVEFSGEPAAGQAVFRFKGESYSRIHDLFFQFTQQKTQLDQLYTELYRDEYAPTPFPTQPSAEQNRTYYDSLAAQTGKYCSLDSWKQDPSAASISVYVPDEGRYETIFMGEVVARCEIYGQMLEALRLAPVLGEVNQTRDTALIRRILGKPELQLTFDSVQPQVNAGGRDAAMYVDDAGSKYYIDLQTGRLAEIDAGFASHPEVPAALVKSMDELRSIATQFAQANSARLAELNKSLVYDEGCKGSICFFRWDARNLPIDWSGTDWAMMPPFLQVGVLTDGQVVTYYNTLDLFQGTVPAEAPQPTPENVISGGTVQDGPFTFELSMYHDPRLTRQPVTPSMYTEMEGFGAYMYWFYTGSEVTGPVTTYWGTEPQVDQLLQATYASIRLGSNGGRTGGILLPGGSMMPGQSKAGDREQVVLKVTTPGGDFGAVLLFTLKQGANGFEPVEISVEVLRPTESPGALTIKGTVRDVMLSARVISLTEPVQGFSTIALTDATRVAYASGELATLDDITPGMLIQASGEPGSPGTLIANEVLLRGK